MSIDFTQMGFGSRGGGERMGSESALWPQRVTAHVLSLANDWMGCVKSKKMSQFQSGSALSVALPSSSLSSQRSAACQAHMMKEELASSEKCS